MVTVYVRIGFFIENIVRSPIYGRHNGNVRRFFFALRIFCCNSNFTGFKRRNHPLFIYRCNRFIRRRIRQLKRLIINDIFYCYRGKRIAFSNRQTRCRCQLVFFYFGGFFYANIIEKSFVGVIAYKRKTNRTFPCDKSECIFMESIRTVCTTRPTYTITVQRPAARLINLRGIRIQPRSMPAIYVANQRIVYRYRYIFIRIQIDLMIVRPFLRKHFHIVFQYVSCACFQTAKRINHIFVITVCFRVAIFQIIIIFGFIVNDFRR